MYDTETKNNQPRLILIVVTSLVIATLLCAAVFGTVFFWNSTKLSSPLVSEESSSSQLTFPIITKNLPLGLTQLELATTSDQKEQGLMFRQELCSTCGMLFVYNTLISLDIIFLDNNFGVVNIASNTKTNQTNELYSSTEPAQYILEVPSNWSSDKKLTKGSIIDFKNNI